MTVLNCYCSLTEQPVPSYPFLFLFSVTQLTKFAVSPFFENHVVRALQVELRAYKVLCLSVNSLGQETRESSLKAIKASCHLSEGYTEGRAKPDLGFAALSIFFKTIATSPLVRSICKSCR